MLTLQKEAQRGVLQYLMDDTPLQGTPSDIFEQAKRIESMEKREEALNLEKIKVELDKTLHTQNAAILQIEGNRLKSEHEINQKLLNINGELMTLKSFMVQEFSAFENKLSQVKESIFSLKNQFGQELLRVDRNLMGVVSQLDKYRLEVERNSTEMKHLKREAEQSNMSARILIEKANNLQYRNETRLKSMSDQLNTNLEKIALREASFTTAVGKAKNDLDTITKDQMYALKDIAFSKVGADMVIKEYGERQKVEQTRMNALIKENNNTLGLIRLRQTQGREIADLQHRVRIKEVQIERARNHSQSLGAQITMFRNSK